MKKAIPLLYFAILSVPTICAQQENTHWNRFVKERLEGLQHISFDMYECVKHPLADTFTCFSVCHYEVDTSSIYSHKLNTHTLLTKDSVWVVDKTHANLSYGSSNAALGQYSIYGYIKNTHFSNLHTIAPFYATPSATQCPGNILCENDTTVSGTPYHVIHTTRLTSLRFNDSTQKFDIPIYDNIDYFIHRHSGWVTLIEKHDPNGTIQTYRFENIAASATESHGGIFRFDNPEYRQYARYDLDSTIPPSIMGTYSPDTLISDALLDYPLVNTADDTVRLRDHNGWTLIEFWTHGCKPCVAFLKSLQHEQDSLGYRRLERDGIRIFCINNMGGMTQVTKDYAHRHHADDIVYMARGLDKLQHRVYPTYYLISPDREVVFHGSILDYTTDTLLFLKRQYLQRHSKSGKPQGAILSIDKTIHDYGTIAEGSDGTHTFRFRNTGDKPLIIERVSSSCGCTAVEYDKQPIAPGKYGTVKVVYNTSHIGSFVKTIVIVSNAENAHKQVLTIRGKVVGKDKLPKQ